MLNVSGNPQHLLNQTNKDIVPKHFDLNIKQPKANITIQYDNIVRGPSVTSKNNKKGNL